MNVIVVDDERILLAVESAMVRRLLPDATVTSFSSSAAALAYATEYPIDLAILDINLGRTSGIDTALKLQRASPHMDVIFCTGYQEFQKEAAQAHPRAYLMKPLSEPMLRDALASLSLPRSG